jgi:hypothetical protein
VTLSIEDILAGAELPEDSVQLCLKGSLRRRYEDLERDLQTASTVAASLGEIAPSKVIGDEMLRVAEEMKPWIRTFTLRAIDPQTWRKFLRLMPKHPGDDATDDALDAHDDLFHPWACRLVALTCVDPAMTAEQAAELHPKLSGGQWRELTNRAYAVNGETQEVPFSAAASEMIGNTAQSLRRRAHGESPTPAGSAKSPPRSRRTSTKTESSSGR